MNEPYLNIGRGEVHRGSIQCTELEDGTPVVLPYLVMRGIKKKPILLLNAALHGDELNGIEVIMKIFEKIDPMELRGTILAVPVVNTLAFKARSRSDPIDKKNLNRVFPGKKEGTVTERIAYHFFNKFVKKATFGIDLHTGMKGHLLVPHPRVRVLNNSSPSLEHPQALGMEIIFYNEGKKGMLNIEAEKIGIPIVCFEIGEAGRLDEYYIKEGIKGVLNFMKYFDMLDGEPKIPEKQILLKDYKEIPSKISGIFHPKVHAGDVVKKNQLLGIISSPFYNEKHYVKSPEDGIIIGIRTQPIVRPGTVVAWFMTFDQGQLLPSLKGKKIMETSSRTFSMAQEKGVEIKS
ncbi:MAG: succinylglutamate desuccinylase/aspartoacylase family protein [Thermoplasmata archaeon]|nr:MAG: succinylglutamate desuccinylase/aspartoacylase family protein [Thermoplasmata archaeon]